MCVDSALSHELTTGEYSGDKKLVTILKRQKNIFFVTICIEMLFSCVLRQTHYFAQARPRIHESCGFYGEGGTDAVDRTTKGRIRECVLC